MMAQALSGHQSPDVQCGRTDSANRCRWQWPQPQLLGFFCPCHGFVKSDVRSICGINGNLIASPLRVRTMVKTIGAPTSFAARGQCRCGQRRQRKPLYACNKQVFRRFRSIGSSAYGPPN
jgi:hypothetical protein